MSPAVSKSTILHRPNALDQQVEESLPTRDTLRNDSTQNIEATNYLLRYLTEKLSLAEDTIAANVIEQLASPSVALMFHAPSLQGAQDAKRKTRRAPAISDGLVSFRRDIIEGSGLFDIDYYRSQFADPLPPDIGPIEHYLTAGWFAGRDPHPAFSVRFYLAQYPDVRASGIDPLTHYIERGSSEMRNPHPFFLNYFYASQHGHQTPQRQTWLGHFVSAVASPVPPHPIFDVDDYAVRAKIDTGSASEALLHYLTVGWRNNIDASPLFRPKYYYSQMGGAHVDLEPYTHYILFGVPRAVGPHPLFDVRRYRSIVNDLDPGLDPLVHYTWKGEAAEISPSALFDVSFYKQKYHREISDRGPFWHYLTEGARRDYHPNPHFDPRAYRAEFMQPGSDYDDILSLEHFAYVGMFASAENAVSKLRISVNAAPIVQAPSTPPKPKLVAPLPEDLVPRPEVREYPGRLEHIEGRPNILLVAHFASALLFGSERSLLDMLEGLVDKI